MIVLLNMLIAIMGEIFSESIDSRSQLLVKDHLRFVLEYWKSGHEMGFSNAKYLATARFNWTK